MVKATQQNVTQYPLHHDIVTDAPPKFEQLGCIYKKIYYLTFDLGVIQNVSQYLLYYVIYASAKFEVATSNSLGEDMITRNVTDRRTTDRLWYELNIPYFSKENAGIIIVSLS